MRMSNRRAAVPVRLISAFQVMSLHNQIIGRIVLNCVLLDWRPLLMINVLFQSNEDRVTKWWSVLLYIHACSPTIARLIKSPFSQWVRYHNILCLKLLLSLETHELLGSKLLLIDSLLIHPAALCILYNRVIQLLILCDSLLIRLETWPLCANLWHLICVNRASMLSHNFFQYVSQFSMILLFESLRWLNLQLDLIFVLINRVKLPSI